MGGYNHSNNDPSISWRPKYLFCNYIFKKCLNQLSGYDETAKFATLKLNILFSVQKSLLPDKAQENLSKAYF
jgi:hypothetical protein